MGAPGNLNPLRKETFENLQLNAGLMLKNFDYSAASDADNLRTAIATAITDGTKLIGATRGGGSFVATREIRSPEIDGKRYPYKGEKFVDSVDAHLSTTILEMTPQRLKDAFGSADITISGQKTSIKVRTAIEDGDYLNSLCWVGELADGRLVLIDLKNALNTTDFNLTWTDKGEGTLPVEFHAHVDDVNEYDYAPFEIIYFEPDGTSASFTVSSAAGTNVGGTALTTTNSLAAGEHYVYKVGTSGAAPTIGYREYADYTWTEWDGSSEVNVGASANGKKATIAVVNGSGRVIKNSGAVTLAVKTA